MSENNNKSRFEELTKFSNDKLSKIAKEIVFNPNEPFDSRFSGLLILIENTEMRIFQMEMGLTRLRQAYKQFCQKAIEEHKKKRITEFTEKWQDKQVCEAMATEMQQIEKPNHCYKFAGSKVIEEDCNMCNNRRCQTGEEDYKPSSFMDLLGDSEETEKNLTEIDNHAE